MQQTFPAGTGQRISIANVAGDLKVSGWDQQVISITSDGDIGTLQPEGDVVTIHDCEDALELAVPYEQIIIARDIDGDISAENVRQVELQEISGNVSLKAITGEVRLGHIDGDLVVEDVPQVHARGNINGEARCERVERLELNIVGGGLELKEGIEANFSNVGGNVDISNTITVRGGHVERDCRVQGNGDSVVELKNVGQDLNASSVAKLQVHHVGKHCLVYDSEHAELMIGHVGINLEVAGASSLQARNVGCDCSLRDIHGQVSIDHVGSGVTVVGVAGNLQIGNIGGNAELKDIQGLLSVGSVGGNMFVGASFPLESVMHLRAGGNIHLVLPSNANLTIQAMVGGIVHGQASVSVMGNHVTLVYGDGSARLEVCAGGNLELYGDQTPKSTSTYSGGWENFVYDWQQQWQDMACQWYDASAEFAAGFGASFTDGLTRVVEKQQRKAEKYRQKAERQARRANEHAARVNIRINNSATSSAGKSTIDLEQERMAILRMVADGRITPEEGDMLLGAL